MKTKSILKYFLFSASLLAGLNSCNYSNAKQDDTKEIHTGYAEATPEDKVTETDSKFLADVTVINLKEIQLGQLAQKLAKTEDVKALGKMMEKDHSACLKEVKSLAEKKSIAVETSLTDKEQEEYKKLNELAGDDFDKEYCNKMIKGHKAAISKFEKASSDCKDNDIKDFATKTLPTLRIHLDHAADCQMKLEKQKS